MYAHFLIITVLEIKFEEHKLQGCKRQEWNRELIGCFDLGSRSIMKKAPNVHRAICALNATSSGMKVRERF